MLRRGISVTEQIIRIIETGRELNVPDAELDQMLLAVGCTRVVHFGRALNIYYIDESGQERFVLIEL